jgi:hypothetical protein
MVADEQTQSTEVLFPDRFPVWILAVGSADAHELFVAIYG